MVPDFDGDGARLIERLPNGGRPLARAISLVEDNRAGADDVVAAAYPHADGWMVGITGPPGAGKSTLVDRLITHIRREGARVAVIAVDPASPFTGGAILGDRIRMQSHVDDPDVYVRSMSNRGHLGGLASATARVAVLLQAAAFDFVLIETVGVGQSEVEIADVADTTLVVIGPGFGDSIQSAKAGLLEVGDVFVVNKSDLPGAREVARELRSVELGRATETWRPPVIEVSSATDTAVGEVLSRIHAHRRDVGAEAGMLRAQRLIRVAVEHRISEATSRFEPSSRLVAAVSEGRRDPWSAAAEMVEGERSGG